MYDVRKELCEQLNLKSIILQDEFELRQIQRRNYTQDLYWKKKRKNIWSRFIFQLSNDFHELRVLKTIY
jgi:hypothetical protein